MNNSKILIGFFVLILPTTILIVDCFHQSTIVEAASSFKRTEKNIDQLFNITGREDDYDDSAVTIYKEPTSIFQTILKEFFADIDWKTITTAREQVEKFLRRLETLWTTFRSSLSNKRFNKTNNANPNDEEPRLFMAKLFGYSSQTQTPTTTSSSLPLDDPTNIKGMLERVACFVGYMRLLTHTQAALADLDSSKVISNLFSATNKDQSSNGFFSNWFG